MTAWFRFALHWTLLHGLVAVLLYRALEGQGLWFLLSEAGLLLSLGIGFRSFSKRQLPKRLAQLGTELIREQDFTSKFRGTGATDVDDLIALFNQMSERLREERLVSSERNYFLERLLEAAPVAIVILDHDGRVSQVNPEAGRLLGLDEPSIVGQPLTVLNFQGEHPATSPSGLGSTLQQLGPSEARLVELEGRTVKASAGHFFDRGFPRRFFVIEELTAELLESERAAYGRLIRTISHEVGNSVGAVGSLLGSVSEMADGLPTDDRETLRRSVNIADTRLRSLNAFINGFAEVVRLPDPERDDCDLIALLDDILILLGPDLDGAQIQVYWTDRPATAMISADKNQLEQLLVNVFRNAIEAIDKTGQLTIDLDAADGTTVAFRLIDNGCGISPEIRRQLYAPFVSTKKEGRGLGLTLVHEIARKHGWGIALLPWAAEDRSGTIFELTFKGPPADP